MSKEDIIKQCITAVPIMGGILKAMDSYAQQEAIAFHNWCIEDKQIMNYNGETTSELYQLYLKIEK